MRYKRRLFYEYGLKQLALAPFVNVFFLLLVFLLLVCGFVSKPGIPVNFPRLILSGLVKQENLDITVTQEGLFVVDGTPRTLAQLKQFFSALPAARISVLVQLEKQAPAEAVIQLWGLCQDVGVTDVSVARTNE